MTERELIKLLNEYPIINDKIDQLNQQLLDELEHRAAALNPLGATVNDGMPHGMNPGDPTYEAARKIVDDYRARIEELSTRIHLLYERRKRIERLLDRLTVRERRLIEMRYCEISKARWYQIADVLRCSISTCRNIERRAKRKMLRAS